MRRHLIALTTFILAVVACNVFAQDEMLSMAEREMVQKLAGKWKIVAASADGRPFEDKVNAIGARFDFSGMRFITRVDERVEPNWSYDEIRLEDHEADIVVKEDGKTHRYAVTLEDDVLWLATKLTENSELPERRKPGVGVFVLILTREAD